MSPLIFLLFLIFSVVPLWPLAFLLLTEPFHIKSLNKYIFSRCLLDTRVFSLKPNFIT